MLMFMKSDDTRLMMMTTIMRMLIYHDEVQVDEDDMSTIKMLFSMKM